MKFSLISLICIFTLFYSAVAREIYIEKFEISNNKDIAPVKAIWHSDFVSANNNTLNFPYRTKFKVAYDDKYLYFYVTSYEPQMDKLNFQKPVHKGWPKGDSIELFLDTKLDRKSYIQLAVGCNGTIYDSRMKNKSWTLNWNATCKASMESWNCMIRIPFVDLGVKTPQAGQIWGFNICRNRKVTGSRESGTWAHVGAVFHSPGKFGRLIFGSPTAANLERLKKLKIKFNRLKKLQPAATPAKYIQKFSRVEKRLNQNCNLDNLTKQINCLNDELQVIIAIDKINKFQKQ